MFFDGLDIGSEIEQPSNSVYDLLQSLHGGKVNGNVETVFARKVLHLDEPGLAPNFDGAFIDVFFYKFDTWNGSRLQKLQHRIPVIRRAIADSKYRPSRNIEGH